MADYNEVNSYMEYMGHNTDHTPDSQVNSAAKGDSERKDQSRYGGTWKSGSPGDNQVDYFRGRDHTRPIGPYDEDAYDKD